MEPISFEEYKGSAYNPGTPINVKNTPSAKLAALRAKNPSLLSSHKKNPKKRKVTERTFLSPEFKTTKMTPAIEPESSKNPESTPSSPGLNKPELLDKGGSSLLTQITPAIEPEPSKNPEPTPSSPDLNNQELLEKVVSSLLTQFLPQTQMIINTAVTEIKTEIEKYRQSVKALAKSVEDLENSQDDVVERVLNIETSLTSKMASIDLDKVKNSILPDISKTVSQSMNRQWIEMLKYEIAQVESILIVHGLAIGEMLSVEKATAFLTDKLKLSPDSLKQINIVSVTSLGKHNNTQSIMIKLSHVTERNICLKNSFNLPKGVTIDRSVPMRYLSKYKDFKSKAWQIRMSQNLMTRIEFQEHSLCLRIRKKDDGEVKYGWTIHEEFTPTVNCPVPSKTKSSKPDTSGTMPTPPLSKAELSMSVIFSNIKSDLTGDILLQKVKAMFNSKQTENIACVSMMNPSTFVVKCSAPEHAKKLAKEFINFKFQNSAIKTSIF